MSTHIALLRGINVGGHNKIAMSDLRGFIADLGFDDVRSLLQTGNLVFRGDARPTLDMERILEVEAERRLDLHTTFLVRTVKEWEAMIERNPFPEAAESDPAHLVTTFLKDVPRPDAVNLLQSAIDGPEVMRTEGRQLYIVYPAGIARSRLTHKLIEDKLGIQGTGRNWNTVLKIAVLASS